MSFPVKPPSGLVGSLWRIASQVKANVRSARQSLGYLPPLASSRQVASQSKQKGLAGIANVAQKGDQATVLWQKNQKGKFH